jgi:hypothetical protein
MCIMFFMSHYDGPRQHCLGSQHCAHTDCPGTFEGHHKYLLEESRFDCSECLAKDGIEMDPDINPVQYYPPIPHFEIQYVEGKGWVKVDKDGDAKDMEKGAADEQEHAVPEQADAGGQNEEKEHGGTRDYAPSFASLSDCDSVTSHWRLDPAVASPVRASATATKEKSPSTSRHEPAPSEEAFETRSQHEPYEMYDVHEPVYEDATENQELGQLGHAEPLYGESPNTLEHRHLVNQQLATLEQQMARRQHRRQLSQSAFDGSPRPRMLRHQRHNSKRRFNAVRPQGYPIPPPIAPVPPGPMGAPPVYEDGQYYMVAAAPEGGINPNLRWGPVPPPHLMIHLPPVSLFSLSVPFEFVLQSFWWLD